MAPKCTLPMHNRCRRRTAIVVECPIDDDPAQPNVDYSVGSCAGMFDDDLAAAFALHDDLKANTSAFVPANLAGAFCGCCVTLAGGCEWSWGDRELHLEVPHYSGDSTKYVGSFVSPSTSSDRHSNPHLCSYLNPLH